MCLQSCPKGAPIASPEVCDPAFAAKVQIDQNDRVNSGRRYAATSAKTPIPVGSVGATAARARTAIPSGTQLPGVPAPCGPHLRHPPDPQSLRLAPTLAPIISRQNVLGAQSAGCGHDPMRCPAIIRVHPGTQRDKRPAYAERWDVLAS